MIQSLLAEKKLLIERRLAQILVADIPEHARLYESMNYSLLAGGKRIRPALFLIVLEVLGAASEPYLDAACALECVHTYSLIHDDLPQMDDDAYRRGKPANHMKYGAGMATMAGDGLLTFAFQLLAGMKAAPPAARCRLITLLAEAAGPSGMVGGQAQDIESENQKISLAALRVMDRCKTGCLLAVPLDMAAVIAGADEKTAEALHSCGLHLGQLFQITDDLLDLCGSLETMGKVPGQDEAKKKSTYISLLGEDGARRYAAEEAALAKENAALLEGKGKPLMELADLLLTRTK